MRLNNRGKVIYEVGDIVQLVDRRPGHWNSAGDMDHYLGKVVTLTLVEYRNAGELDSNPHPTGSFRFGGSEGWNFRVDEDIVSTPVTPEVMKEYEDRKARQLAAFKEKLQSFVVDPQAIYEIAKDIFGEQFVDLRNASSTYFEIIVHFPEVNITNSKRHQHLIKDLYVKFEIDLTLADASLQSQISTIRLHGWRGSLSEEEFQSSYSHSHFSGNGIERWSDFCLGSSDFAMIINTMKFSLTHEDWTLLFLSLENYVSWESIEGGPYKHMQSVSLRRESVNPAHYRDHALEIAKSLPNAALTISEGSLTLLEDHPALIDHYDAHTRIKTFRSDGSNSYTNIETRFNRYVAREGMLLQFKDQSFRTRLYRKNGSADQDKEGHIDQEVVTFYNNTIKQELKKYSISYDYEKLYASSTRFREVSPF